MRCSRCEQHLPDALFPTTGDGRPRNPCRRCRAAYMREWKARDPDRARVDRERANARHARFPEERRATKLRKFGLTIADYDSMLEAQGYVCAICLGPETTIDTRTKQPRALAVDHCHETGAVRALLCGDCNRSLGMMKEDQAALLRMVEYLGGHAPTKRKAA